MLEPSSEPLHSFVVMAKLVADGKGIFPRDEDLHRRAGCGSRWAAPPKFNHRAKRERLDLGHFHAPTPFDSNEGAAPQNHVTTLEGDCLRCGHAKTNPREWHTKE